MDKESIFENKRILAKGYRNEQPIALIELNKKDNIEYVVAFNYKISKEKLEWGYGDYYNNDIKKARDDFHKVINGGDLVNTFENKRKDRER
jgi:uncharacterized protein (DUF608 family)